MFQQDAHIQLERQHGLKGLKDQINLSGYDPMVRFNVNQLESALLTGLQSKVLRLENLTGKIVDFGCGDGVSTAALSCYGGDVTGVELDSLFIERGRMLGFVPMEKIVNGDGLAHLRSLPKGSLDLVNASMLGPDMDGSLSREFLLACYHALKPGGVILVTSDFGTLSTLVESNPLNNGFIQEGVFLAVRGIDDLADSPQFRIPPLGKSPSASGMDFSTLLEGFDLGDLSRKLRFED